MAAMFDPFMTTTELARRLLAGELSAIDAVEGYLTRIVAHHGQLNAVVTLDATRARERAHLADAARARGESWGPLHGVPFTLKDAISTAGVRTTVGHASLDHVPGVDATVAARLQAAGAILLGKTNVPPFLMRAQTDNDLFGRTNNPHALQRTVGGSSGGSGAAVAAGLTGFDIGSDMSGSIRIPANYCGVYGLKPSAGRIPTTGHLPPPPGVAKADRMMAVLGPLARSVDDLALLFRVLAGPDGSDVDVPPVPVAPIMARDPRSLRIAFLPAFPDVPTSRAVSAATREVAERLARAGAHVEERAPFSFEAMRTAWAAYLSCVGATMQETMAATLPAGPRAAVPPTLGEWAHAQYLRDQVIVELEGLFQSFDAFLCPLGISEAFPHGPPKGTLIPVDGTPVESRFVDHYLFPFNLTGSPAVALPAARHEGLPIGVQLAGKRWGDEALLGVALGVDTLLDGFMAPAAFV
jgi:amidase